MFDLGGVSAIQDGIGQTRTKIHLSVTRLEEQKAAITGGALVGEFDVKRLVKKFWKKKTVCASIRRWKTLCYGFL